MNRYANPIKDVQSFFKVFIKYVKQERVYCMVTKPFISSFYIFVLPKWSMYFLIF